MEEWDDRVSNIYKYKIKNSPVLLCWQIIRVSFKQISFWLYLLFHIQLFLKIYYSVRIKISFYWNKHSF